MDNETEQKELNLDSKFNYELIRLGGFFGKFGNDSQEDDTEEDLTYVQIQELFNNNGIIKKIICKYPSNAKSTGYHVLNKDGVSINKNDTIILEGFYNASIYGRLYGYSCLAFETSKSFPEDPIKIGDKISGFKISNITTKTGDFYNIENENFHYTKVFKFYGDKKFLFENPTAEVSELYKNQSIIQKLYKSFGRLKNANKATRYIVDNLSYLLVGIKNLNTLNSNDAGKELLSRKMMALNRERSMDRLISYDLDKEDLKFINQSLSGIDDVLNNFKIMLASESEYPYEQLFENGTSPGIGSGIQNQLISRFLWQQKVNEWIDNNWLYNYQLLIERLFGEGFTVDIPFNVQLSVAERAELELKIATRNKTLVDAGIISTEEARVTYHGNNLDFNLKLEDYIPEDEKEINITEKVEIEVENNNLENTQNIRANNLGVTLDSVELNRDDTRDLQLTDDEFDAIANVTMADVLGVLEDG